MDRPDPVPEGILRLTPFHSFPITLLSTLWSCGATIDSARLLGCLPGLGILMTDDV